MGRKRVINSAEEFAGKVLDFIKVCANSDTSPTDYELWQYLGVKPSEWDALSRGQDQDGKPWPSKAKDEDERRRAEERDKVQAEDAVKKLVAFREDRLVKKLEESKNVNGNTIFLLKQAKNGGYQDTMSQDLSASVTVKVEGVGGLDAFK